MKTILKILLIVSLNFIGCSSPTVRHTKYEQQIEEKQKKLTDDAKDFLVKANEMLSIDSGTIDIKRVRKLLQKSQSLLNVNVDDGKELRDLTGDKLDIAIDKVFQEDEKEKESIADLKIKDEYEISKIISDNIEAEAIRKYERAKTVKLYAICATILSVLGALFYFYPTKFLNIGSSLVGFLFKK